MLLQLLIYVSIGVFIVANLLRFIRIANLPVHLRWELYPVPHESREKVRYGGSYLEESDWQTKTIHSNRVGELLVMLPEIFLLKGIWENNRRLWLWSWLFHIGLYLLIGTVGLTLVGVLLELTGLTTVTRMTTGFGGFLYHLVQVVYWTACIIGILGTALMLIIRTTSPRLKSFLSFGIVFNLTIILAVFVTGLVSLASVEQTAGQMFGLVKGIISLSRLPSIDTAMAVHIVALLLLILYFPFTHMTHAYTKFFTYHSIRWDDRPLDRGGKLERKIDKALRYPVSWSAPHIGGEERKTWLDVATEEVHKDG